MKRKKRKYRFNKKLMIIVIFFAIVLLGVFGPSLARYIYLGIREHYLESQNFYFNSDKLGATLSRYQVDNWSGVEPYKITVNMDSFKNNNVSADTDISYDITYRCSSNVTCEVSKTQGVIQTTTHQDSFIVTITPSTTLEDGDSVWLEVYTNATEPYTKELSGRFVINIGKIGLSYEIDDKANQPYLELRITNTLDYYNVLEDFSSYKKGDKIDISTYTQLTDEEKDKCASVIVTLQFDPNVVVFDMTSKAYLKRLSTTTTTINNHQYVNSISFKIDAISSEFVNLYKINAANDYTYPFVNQTPVINLTYS